MGSDRRRCRLGSVRSWAARRCRRNSSSPAQAANQQRSDRASSGGLNPAPTTSPAQYWFPLPRRRVTTKAKASGWPCCSEPSTRSMGKVQQWGSGQASREWTRTAAAIAVAYPEFAAVVPPPLGLPLPKGRPASRGHPAAAPSGAAANAEDHSEAADQQRHGLPCSKNPAPQAAAQPSRSSSIRSRVARAGGDDRSMPVGQAQGHCPTVVRICRLSAASWKLSARRRAARITRGGRPGRCTRAENAAGLMPNHSSRSW